MITVLSSKQINYCNLGCKYCMIREEFFLSKFTLNLYSQLIIVTFVIIFITLECHYVLIGRLLECYLKVLAP